MRITTKKRPYFICFKCHKAFDYKDYKEFNQHLSECDPIAYENWVSNSDAKSAVDNNVWYPERGSELEKTYAILDYEFEEKRDRDIVYKVLRLIEEKGDCPETRLWLKFFSHTLHRRGIEFYNFVSPEKWNIIMIFMEKVANDSETKPI